MTEPVSPPPSNRPAWMLVALIAAGAALGLWLVTLWLPGLLTTTPGTPAASAGTAAATTAAPDARRIHASLFYLSSTADRLVPVEAEVPFAPSPAEQARRIVEAQLAPAPAGQTSPVPAGATVRALYLTGRGEAYLDLSGDIRRNHPGGSLAEALTVYAIVNVLTVNMPDITAVQLLLDGQEADTLAGHIDLRHPLRRGARWIER